MPSIAVKVNRCVVMGGAPCCEGNVTPAAEYNIWCDPEAARIVMRSGLPVELVGWHLCRGEALLNPVDIQQVLSFGTGVAKFSVECNSRAQKAILRQTGEHGISLPDPVAMAWPWIRRLSHRNRSISSRWKRREPRNVGHESGCGKESEDFLGD
jgi:purine nucleosidase